MEKLLSTKYTRSLTLTDDTLTNYLRVGLTGEGNTQFIIRDLSYSSMSKNCYSMVPYPENSDIVFAMLLARMALDEWRYMKLVDRRSIMCDKRWPAGHIFLNHPVITLGESANIVLNGEEIGEYDGILQKLKSIPNRIFLVGPDIGNVQFKVKGPNKWSYRGLRKFRKSNNRSYGLLWEKGSHMGPMEVEFVVADMVRARHGSVGEWVGSQRKKGQL